MKITHIVTETTTAGSVATVATPLFKQNRKGGNLLTGTKTKKKYANSVNEGKVKELQMDLSSGVNGLSDEEFKQKYGKTKQEMRKLMGPPSKPQPNPQSSKQVDEAKLDEEDLILVPGMGRRLKSGFISNKEDRTDHEVEMACSDLFQSAKNAKKVYELISNISEEQGLEGWVQEKIIKANDYLNTIREYLEHKVMTKEGMKGRLAGGVAGAAITRTPMGAVTGAGIGSDLEDMFREATMGAGVIAGGPQYEGMAEGSGSKEKQKTPYRDINSPEYRAAADKQKQRMAQDKAATPGKKMLARQGVAEGEINEKAVSQAQQKFMGMVHATQKGEKPASSEVAKVAKSMPKKAAKDFAQTKHKGLPQHVGKKDKE